ncbi:MAG: glycosyltransferase [Bacteroidota bacterium]
MDASRYLQKHRFYPRLLTAPVPENLGMAVVIPCYNEPDLQPTLEALWRCERPRAHVEVLVVVNGAVSAVETVRERNRATVRQARHWMRKHPDPGLTFHVLECPELPDRHAGVGLARKIGMDEAVDRLAQAGREGVLVCFDADATCAPNYLVALEDHFARNPHSPACSLRFEHPTDGHAFAPEVYAGIVRYELFLRYYRQGLHWAGHPHAFHTIGSSMAVRTNAYCQQGGMNRRKAGEDFYFLQKLIPLGGFTELNTTCVFPSPRPSDRVPFGTGRAIGQWLQGPQLAYPAYDPQTFVDLRTGLGLLQGWADAARQQAEWQHLPAALSAFLEQQQVEAHLAEIRANSASPDRFVQRFYRWFNAFLALKFTHYARDVHYPAIGVEDAARGLLRCMDHPAAAEPQDALGLLKVYRELDGYAVTV